MSGLRAGAAGYLSKEVELAALPRALRGALNGEAAISRALAMTLMQRLRQSPWRRHRHAARPLVADRARVGGARPPLRRSGHRGRSPNRLVLSTETVRSHLKRVYRKLDVNSRDDAVHAAQADARAREPAGLTAPAAGAAALGCARAAGRVARRGQRRDRHRRGRAHRARARAAAERSASRLFTDGERAYAERRARPAMHLAARFCAKEAVAKALELRAWSPRDVEVVGGGDEPPSVRLTGHAAARAAELGARVVDLAHPHADHRGGGRAGRADHEPARLARAAPRRRAHARDRRVGDRARAGSRRSS